MSAQPRIPDFPPTRRRSQRVVMQIPIRVCGDDIAGRAFDEETETLAINAHGAFILLQGRVSRGAQITLKHNRTGEEQECRVLHVGPLLRNKAEIGLEFSSPRPHFWRVHFPPQDWTPKSLEARKPVVSCNRKEKSSVPSAGLLGKS
jgi:hypothetical protein